VFRRVKWQKSDNKMEVSKLSKVDPGGKVLWSEEYMNVDAVAERKKGAYARSGSSSYVF